MLSNHSQTEVTSSHVAHLERAKRLLGPDCPVLAGNGRWCLRTPVGAYLFETRAEAVRSVLDPNSRYVRIFDIGTDEEAMAALERISDRHPDR